MNLLAHNHPVMKDPLVMRARLFGNASARLVIHCHNNFHSYQSNLLKRITCCKLRRSHGNALTAATRPHPVAEIAQMVDGMDMTQTATAENRSAFCFGDQAPSQTPAVPHLADSRPHCEGREDSIRAHCFDGIAAPPCRDGARFARRAGRQQSRVHVRSDIAPTIGCTISPVSGPASQRYGRFASSAPRYL